MHVYVVEIPCVQPNSMILFVVCQLLREIPECLGLPGHCSASNEYITITFAFLVKRHEIFIFFFSLSSVFSPRTCNAALLLGKESFMAESCLALRH